ncbi:hypothetical protein L596_022769 [Steinernema carpocapsae]|uniref:SANT domain-containing protein n=1 Tax=Steinernema carpocapsae TaxID=34508 RepID=A0A4U5MN79_STECR|nr:hypothetical protein L596_022769 [Steinernema carpocapsae]
MAPKRRSPKNRSPPTIQVEDGKESSTARFLKIHKENVVVEEKPQVTESRVGSSYQAEIPDFDPNSPVGPSTHKSETLWIPQSTDHTVKKLYKKILSPGNNERDLDQEDILHALYTSEYRIPEAIKKAKLTEFANPPRRTMTFPCKRFDKQEIRYLEDGILTFGKNFFKIRKRYFPKRTVGELVNLYYFWKKRRTCEQLVYRCMDYMDVMTDEIVKLQGVGKQ